jgi:hypothetical protein
MGTKKINFNGSTLFKVLDGASYTVPSVIDQSSPTGRSSGVYPTDTFSSKKDAVGGQILFGFSDEAGNDVDEINYPLEPGDVVACAAIGSGVSVVTVTPAATGVAITIATITATAVCGVIGFVA